jgi:hypothetical protein
VRLCKKNIFFKPGKLGTSIFTLEMAWSSHLINVTNQKAEKKKKKKSHFFPLFSTSILTTSSYIALEPLWID